MMTGDEYRAARKRLGLTQAGLAERLGVDRMTVGARERGQVRITTEAELAILHLAATAEKGATQ